MRTGARRVTRGVVFQCKFNRTVRHMTPVPCCHRPVEMDMEVKEVTSSSSLDTIGDLPPGYSSELDKSIGAGDQASGTTEEEGTPLEEPGVEEPGDDALTTEWAVLDAVGCIMTSQEDDNMRYGQPQAVGRIVDSWAAKVVAPPACTADYQARSSPGPRSGGK